MYRDECIGRVGGLSSKSVELPGVGQVWVGCVGCSLQGGISSRRTFSEVASVLVLVAPLPCNARCVLADIMFGHAAVASRPDGLRTLVSPCVAVATCLTSCFASSLNKSRVVRHAKKLQTRAAEPPQHDIAAPRAPAQSLGGGAVRDTNGRVWMAGPSDTWLTRMHDGRWIYMNSVGSVRLAEQRDLDDFRSVHQTASLEY